MRTSPEEILLALFLWTSCAVGASITVCGIKFFIFKGAPRREIEVIRTMVLEKDIRKYTIISRICMIVSGVMMLALTFAMCAKKISVGNYFITYAIVIIPVIAIMAVTRKKYSGCFFWKFWTF